MKKQIDLEKFKKEISIKFTKVSGCHEWEHTERVYNMAIHIGKKEKANLKVLGLAALFHDIAREEEDKSNGKIDHAEKGAILAKEILGKYDLTDDELGNIAHCIQTHRYRNNKIPETIEAKILYDSDKLDGIGAIGIGRAFSFAGQIGAKVHNKGVDLNKTKQYSKDDTAWREYELKLKYLKDKMLTKEGKKIAVKRSKFMKDFFNRINNEVDGIE